jgi:hypothetical protein
MGRSRKRRIGWLDLRTKDAVEHRDSIQILLLQVVSTAAPAGVVEDVDSDLVAAAMDSDLMAAVNSERRQAVDSNLITLVESNHAAAIDLDQAAEADSDPSRVATAVE